MSGWDKDTLQTDYGTLNRLRVIDLKGLCDKYSLSKSGKKNDLLKTVTDFLEDELKSLEDAAETSPVYERLPTHREPENHEIPQSPSQIDMCEPTTDYSDSRIVDKLNCPSEPNSSEKEIVNDSFIPSESTDTSPQVVEGSTQPRISKPIDDLIQGSTPHVVDSFNKKVDVSCEIEDPPIRSSPSEASATIDEVPEDKVDSVAENSTIDVISDETIETHDLGSNQPMETFDQIQTESKYGDRTVETSPKNSTIEAINIETHALDSNQPTETFDDIQESTESECDDRTVEHTLHSGDADNSTLTDEVENRSQLTNEEDSVNKSVITNDTTKDFDTSRFTDDLSSSQVVDDSSINTTLDNTSKTVDESVDEIQNDSIPSSSQKGEMSSSHSNIDNEKQLSSKAEEMSDDEDIIDINHDIDKDAITEDIPDESTLKQLKSSQKSSKLDVEETTTHSSEKSIMDDAYQNLFSDDSIIEIRNQFKPFRTLHKRKLSTTIDDDNEIKDTDKCHEDKDGGERTTVKCSKFDNSLLQMKDVITSNSLSDLIPNMKSFLRRIDEKEIDRVESESEDRDDRKKKSKDVSSENESCSMREEEEDFEQFIEIDEDIGEISESIIRVDNLVRPFTIQQLKDLLKRTGKLVEEVVIGGGGRRIPGFWIDKIKSSCIVTYENGEDANDTITSLDGIRWPASNPKLLSVRMSNVSELNKASKLGDVEKQQNGKSPTKKDKIDEEKKSDSQKKSRDEGQENGEIDIKSQYEDRLNSHPSNEMEDEKDYKSRHKSRGDMMLTVGENEDTKGEMKKSKKSTPKSLEELFRKTKAQPPIFWLPYQKNHHN